MEVTLPLACVCVDHQSLATLLITSQILNQVMEAFLPYWLQRRRNKKAHKRMRRLMGDKELPLLEQVQLETEMNTYLVGPSNHYHFGFCKQTLRMYAYICMYLCIYVCIYIHIQMELK